MLESHQTHQRPLQDRESPANKEEAPSGLSRWSDSYAIRFIPIRPSRRWRQRRRVANHPRETTHPRVNAHPTRATGWRCPLSTTPKSSSTRATRCCQPVWATTGWHIWPAARKRTELRPAARARQRAFWSAAAGLSTAAARHATRAAVRAIPTGRPIRATVRATST